MDEKEASVYLVVVISSIIIGFIIAYFLYSIIRQHRKNEALQRKLILAEITALEKDRARIASDLHDEISPVFAGIKIKINSFELTSGEDKVELQRINKYIDNMFTRMKEISFDLVPTVLFREGLLPAVRELADFINTKNGLCVTLSAESELALNEQQAINIYRIVQETIHNTIKHANASDLGIRISAEKNSIVLHIRDNGVGFDNTAVVSTSPSGLGLKSLFNRTRLLNGEMFIDSKKGEGTNYTFTIPLA